MEIKKLNFEDKDQLGRVVTVDTGSWAACSRRDQRA